MTPGIAAGTGEVATNLAQLEQALEGQPRTTLSMHIEGDIWWSSPTEGRVILHDPSAVVLLELDVPSAMPSQGQRVLLSGDCTAVRTPDAVKLCDVPVVENDGLHAAEEASGAVGLRAGLHPIRVVWFNRTDRHVLEVAYEGPGVTRQRIPDSALFRAEVDPAGGKTNLVSGLDYRCVEGAWWSVLPNLNHLPARRSGVTDGFELGVRTRNEHVGLQFSGFLSVPRAGDYHFHLRSDDGSRLFIGEPSLHLPAIGRAKLPSPTYLTSGAGPAGGTGYVWGQVEGTVASVNHLEAVVEVDLITASGRVRVRMAEGSDKDFLIVPGNRLRAVGVCQLIRGAEGLLSPGKVFVQSWADLQQDYISPQLWASYPSMAISNLLALALPDGSTPIVQGRGILHAAPSNQVNWLADGSAGIAVEIGQSDRSPGQSLAVLGRLCAEGTNRWIRAALVKPEGETGVLPRDVPGFTTAEQVHQLSREELSRGYPVQLRGVVTAVLQGDAAVVQDATRGIYVSIRKPIPLQVGDQCTMLGTTAPGEFSPFIQVAEVTMHGSGELPVPIQPSWDQLLNGSLHCQYVELEGVVIARTGDTLTLLTRDGRIRVALDSMAPRPSQEVRHALVRMRGCLFASWDDAQQRVKVGDIRLNHDWLSVEVAAPLDPFCVPMKTIGDLFRFDPRAGALRRVRVRGQVMHRGEAGWFLMDKGEGVRVIPADEATAEVGDWVEAVGFPELSGPSPVIEEALLRPLGSEPLPAPRALTSEDLVRDELDAVRVRIEALLLGLTRKPEGYVLEMQHGFRPFAAVLPGGGGLPRRLVIGSRLELTGTYVGLGGNRALGRPIDSFQILLNSGQDVRVLAKPPWWTLKRFVTVLSVLMGVLLAALLWIKLLHQRVRERTLELSAQIHQRQQAERARVIEQERARVAHDLHDDLGAGLTEVNMLTALAASPQTPPEEKSRYLDTLNEKARSMLTSLDEIVWAVNPRNDTLASLAGYLGAYAQRVLELSTVACALDVQEGLPDQVLDPKFRQELFLAFKEAITNVITHAGARKMWLRLAVENGDVLLVVTDDGCGFQPGASPPGADGLANMSERLQRLGGQFEIQSAPGQGTTVRLRAPLP